ncbi:ubiquitin carboxyl-terminal hydrolase 49 [Colossoma macropomum]|uniref:ubiquitin carboxyl-terminal hydrolase 49 n=1 Tax=Colossoma macropomum TaxID=42526 RepID=UPI001864F6EF|nr:ubiquitin carboxyl-terminal hydrolase 49 [Colossoma macropomum]XP_036415882.1 ubiquitin carboxyl-terminal hydrolase 49 [Colossoma macropomum]XP_036415883.1 ubiquitin carboxyl-terminal hydrolase 49 [Colossoma macropomum]XP_036415884.1 ubiquitin carboxyl-terminal hydrolase 49 [Colossoma macropomum]
MDRCKHVVRLRLGHDHSTLNPQKWRCVDCDTTESVWACLKCSHVACGRYIEEHSLRHYQETQHPLAMEVRELDVFCFACGDYVLNDNAEGDLKLLRGALSTVRSPGQRSLRSSSSGGECSSLSSSFSSSLRAGSEGFGSRTATQAALWHRRRTMLAVAFRRWRNRQLEEQRKRDEKVEQEREELRKQRREVKKRLMEEQANVPPRKSARLLTQAPRPTLALIPRKFRDPPERPPPPPLKQQPLQPLSNKPLSNKPSRPLRNHSNTGKPRRCYVSSSQVRRRRLAPGVTGLRNLGNTCYMNSILQVLSHLQKFRECFLTLDLCETEELLAKSNHPQGVRGVSAGMIGNAGALSALGKQNNGPVELVQPKEPRCSSRQQMSLCHELHTLFRVMWSGRWTLVSPFAMLHSVWNLIPAFRGYNQQDAQEFLCELLDKVQQELESDGSRKRRIVIPITQRKLSKQVLKVLNTIFHGQLLSQVTCLSCKHKSNTVEPFWDLSLEFPERYHSLEKASACQRSCTLTEMLAKFTETEALEGCIYACNFCNRRRRKSSHKPLALSEACKQLLIYRLPQVLRLHLKRFRWSGRNHREKIGVHVAFDQVLNMEPYCCSDSRSALQRQAYTYDLSAVVMHHGKGFGSGHYTAYCYNTEGGFWVHCNDSEMNVCSVEEVCSTQAYILFYTQRSS